MSATGAAVSAPFLTLQAVAGGSGGQLLGSDAVPITEPMPEGASDAKAAAHLGSAMVTVFCPTWDPVAGGSLPLVGGRSRSRSPSPTRRNVAAAVGNETDRSSAVGGDSPRRSDSPSGGGALRPASARRPDSARPDSARTTGGTRGATGRRRGRGGAIEPSGAVILVIDSAVMESERTVGKCSRHLVF